MTSTLTQCSASLARCGWVSLLVLTLFAPGWAAAHTSGGIHTKRSQHDLTTFFQTSSPDNSPEYTEQYRSTVLLVQDLLLFVTLNYFAPAPGLSSSHAIKILNFIQNHSGVWDQYDAIFQECSHPTTITTSLAKGQIFAVLGLDEVSTETLLLSLEITHPAILTYDHLPSRAGYTITLLNPTAPFCFLRKHQNHLINHGIYNMKQYLPQ